MNSQNSWLGLSVQEFFSNCNWQGNPVTESKGQVPGQTPTLAMSVATFFRGISWEGTPTVGALPTTISPNTPDVSEGPPDVTLDDLLSLF